jgi:hypothetical protein
MSDGGSSGLSSSRSAPSSSTMSDRTSGAPPARSDQRAQSPRSSGGGQSTGRSAVPRGEGGSSSRDNGGREGGRVASGSRSASESNGSTGSSRSSADGDATQRRAVPAYSRPRDGRPVTGEAVARSTYPVPPINNIYYYPYYYPYGFWGPGYGFGLGYMFYDPFYYGGYGYGYPGYGYGGGYGGGGYGGGGYYSGGGGYSQSNHDTGGLRLKIKPREGQVYVDGYFVGEVDDFDGTFQKLNIDGGGHRIEIKADGFEPLQFEVVITPGDTVTYKGEMKRIQ